MDRILVTGDKTETEFDIIVLNLTVKRKVTYEGRIVELTVIIACSEFPYPVPLVLIPVLRRSERYLPRAYSD